MLQRALVDGKDTIDNQTSSAIKKNVFSLFVVIKNLFFLKCCIPLSNLPQNPMTVLRCAF